MDNVKREVLIDESDQISLDGKRLILISGTNLSNNSTYGFEVEDYSRVTAKTFGSTNSIDPDYFELVDDNGTITTFGRENKSQIKTPRGNFAWRICKVQDVNGNYMTYHYGNTKTTLDGESYLDYINYTMNPSDPNLVDPYFKVKFNYNKIIGRDAYLNNHTIPNNLILTSMYPSEQLPILPIFW